MATCSSARSLPRGGVSLYVAFLTVKTFLLSRFGLWKPGDAFYTPAQIRAFLPCKGNMEETEETFLVAWLALVNWFSHAGQC